MTQQIQNFFVVINATRVALLSSYLSQSSVSKCLFDKFYPIPTVLLLGLMGTTCAVIHHCISYVWIKSVYQCQTPDMNYVSCRSILSSTRVRFRPLLCLSCPYYSCPRVVVSHFHE